VTNPEKEDAEIAESSFKRAVLRLKFHDIAGNKFFKNENTEVAIDEEQAQSILSFVREHLAEIELVVCQCEEGVSRSAAIAAALSKILNGQDDFFFNNYWVNRWVYKLLLKNAKSIAN
jgi:predicted protein tyrosine phosphatase